VQESPDTGSGGAPGTVAVIIIDHGSRRASANASLEEFVRNSAHALPYPIVEPAHMELAEPSLASAFDRCVAAGASTVAIAPYFLGPGSHWDRDIPALAAAASARHPGVRWLVAAPLGPDRALAEIIATRVAHCLDHVAGRAAECPTCAGSGRCTLR